MIHGADGGVEYKNVLLWSVKSNLRSTKYFVTRRRSTNVYLWRYQPVIASTRRSGAMTGW
jgi:hypothetical protein